jgi:small subunit ribosomal protein S23
LPIHYIEDDVRRQFFRDHPFESFRPVTLVESGNVADEHPINGKEWTRLRQRGRNPTAEDVVKFTVNLHKFHEIPLSQAYARAVAQFRSLRGEHHIATTTAALEAEAYGAIFPPTAIEQGFVKEQKQIEAWKSKDELDAGAIVARKRWRAIIERQGRVGSKWSKGQDYVRLWKDGVRPTYAPSLTEPTVEEPTPQEIAESADFMMATKR